MEIVGISARIEKVIEDKKLNPNLFANELGIKTTVIYNILKNRNKPGFDLLLKICGKYNVNANWLLTGEGEMYLGSISNDIIEKDSVKNILSRLANSQLLYIEFHLSDIQLNLKLLQESLTKQTFDRKEYEASQKNMLDLCKGLKAVLKSQIVTDKSLAESLLTFDEGIRIYLDSIRDLSKELYLNAPR
jgi:transcriptional regulator with XRE-family HTH domain